MTHTLRLLFVAAAFTFSSTAASAQDIPLNIFVTGSTGGEVSSAQASGSLTVTTSTAATVATAAATLKVSSGSSTSTN